MNRNKIVYGNETLIDLTSDTVTAADLAKGVTAHDRSGTQIVGTGMGGHTIIDKDGTSMATESGLQFLNSKVTDDSTNGKTVVQHVVEVTQAQYDALPSSKLTDGITYRITDATAGQIDSENVDYKDVSVADALDDMTDAANVLGAKNLLNVTTPTTTVTGIVFTVNSDGSVSAVGTNTGESTAIFDCTDYLNVTLPLEDGAHYILSGCPSGGGSNKYRMWVSQYYNGEWHNIYDDGNGVEFVGVGERTMDACCIAVAVGQTVDLVFRPMIRLAACKDSTFVPYAKSNRDLTVNMFEFSTTEQRVGTWIDGKPIYQKTLTNLITTTITPTADNERAWVDLADLSALNIATIVDIKGVLKYNNASIVELPMVDGSGYSFQIAYLQQSGQYDKHLRALYYATATGIHFNALTATIRYTKTTD